MNQILSNIKLSRAINDAYYARENWKTLAWQIVITAGFIGIANESWIWFGIGLVVLFTLLRMPYVGAVLCVILGSAIGLFAGLIATGLGGEECGWVVGIIVGLGMIYINLNGRSRLNPHDRSASLIRFLRKLR